MNKWFKYSIIVALLAVAAWFSYGTATDFFFPIDSRIEPYVSSNFSKISSIDPSDPDTTGYAEIADAIGDSRVVFLGEQDHGDASTFLAKTKLIKYLHQKLDFDVLIFESDFFALNYILENDTVKNGKYTGYQDNIYPVWSHCPEIEDLFNYLDANVQKEGGMIVSGVDPRHIMPVSEAYLSRFILPYLAESELVNNPDSLALFEDYLEKLLSSEYDSAFKNKDHQWYFNVLDRVEANLPDSLFAKQELKNLRSGIRNSLSNSANIRDIQMSNNLMWLLKYRFTNKKVIFWGANYHIFRGFENLGEIYKGGSSLDTTNMGTVASDLLGDDLYILGFTSFEGITGWVYSPKNVIQKPSPNHIEFLIEKKGAQYGFVDFRHGGDGHGMGDVLFWSNFLGHQPRLSKWGEMFDGIFFIKTISPCIEDSKKQVHAD
ncbi:erythromycin esterase family protein [Anditalea andensis]|uniref:Erythromycin esterase n=1 Tax=Anditalea andensis TaxID=1048983 RepID=A0A074KTT5_9BACT|nr:erythromycin esterase family protein [Anditalea andensis]KEO71650.1 hypothetical protein EL17_23630 [Anditalea andensis]